MSRYLIALAALAVVSASRVPPTPDARALIEAGKAASGGSVWDRLDGSLERGTHGGMAYQTWLDFRHYGMRSEAGGRVRGFNGQVTWQIAPDGDVQRGSDPAMLAEAITTAFSSNNGFFFPDRFPMTARYLRADALGDHAFDVVEVAPRGGRAFELWFDRATHLLGRIGDLKGSPAVTVDISDYRKVGPVLIGFHGVIRLADGTVADELNLASVELGAADRSLFDPPGAR